MNALAASTAIATGRVRLVTLRRQCLSTARLRLLWVALVFALVALVAVLRILYLGVADRTVASTSLEDALLPPRGEITDRNGQPLARAFPAYALWYNPEALGDDGSPLIRSPQQVAAHLKAIFPDLDEAETAMRLATGKAGYLRRRVLPEDANKVQALGEQIGRA